MEEQEQIALLQRAMSAAQAYGCEAAIETAASACTGDPPGSLRLKIAVARRTTRGELLSCARNVLLVTGDHAAAVERIVREEAAKLAKRDIPNV